MSHANLKSNANMNFVKIFKKFNALKHEATETSLIVRNVFSKYIYTKEIKTGVSCPRNLFTLHLHRQSEERGDVISEKRITVANVPTNGSHQTGREYSIVSILFSIPLCL